jgi:hypothetical protein
MPHLEYFVVCELVSVDASTNSVSLFNVLDDIHPDEFPYWVANTYAVSSWNLGHEDEGRDYQTALRVILPHDENASREEIDSNDFAMNIDRNQHRVRAIQGVANIPLQRPGNLVFEVLLNGNRCATHTVIVHPVAE